MQKGKGEGSSNVSTTKLGTPPEPKPAKGALALGHVIADIPITENANASLLAHSSTFLGDSWLLDSSIAELSLPMYGVLLHFRIQQDLRNAYGMALRLTSGLGT